MLKSLSTQFWEDCLQRVLQDWTSRRMWSMMAASEVTRCRSRPTIVATPAGTNSDAANDTRTPPCTTKQASVAEPLKPEANKARITRPGVLHLWSTQLGSVQPAPVDPRSRSTLSFLSSSAIDAHQPQICAAEEIHHCKRGQSSPGWSPGHTAAGDKQLPEPLFRLTDAVVRCVTQTSRSPATAIPSSAPHRFSAHP